MNKLEKVLAEYRDAVAIGNWQLATLRRGSGQAAGGERRIVALPGRWPTCRRPLYKMD